MALPVVCALAGAAAIRTRAARTTAQGRNTEDARMATGATLSTERAAEQIAREASEKLVSERSGGPMDDNVSAEHPEPAI